VARKAADAARDRKNNARRNGKAGSDMRDGTSSQMSNFGAMMPVARPGPKTDGYFIENGMEIPVTKLNTEKMPQMTLKSPQTLVSDRSIVLENILVT
jgi:hypothetical protein